MKVSELLIKAKTIIENPENWTQEHLARDHVGYPTDPNANCAVCFCSVGALRKAHIPWTDTSYMDASRFLFTAMNGNVPEFNDTHTHAEVMHAWDKAIADALESEKVVK